MRNAIGAVLLTLLVACGGKTEVVDEPVADASAADAKDASADAVSEPSPEAEPEAAFDGALWEQCFGSDGTGPAWDLKICKGSPCVIKQHELDCCGTIEWFGVAQGKEAAFDACEASWREHLGLCNCPAGIPKTEQPKTEVTDILQVEAQCMNCTMESCLCLTSPK
jgi:hypothetical protein